MINRPLSNIRRKENFHSTFQGEIAPLYPRLNFDLLRDIGVSTPQKRESVERGTSTTEGVYPRREEEAVVRASRVAGHIEKARRDEAYELGIMSP